MKHLSAGLSVAIAILAGISSAEALVLCVNSSGSVTALPVCKPGWTQLDVAAAGLTGPAGPQGNPGINGTNGTNGINGVSGYEIVQQSESFAATDNSTVLWELVMYCPDGKKVLGGGGEGTWHANPPGFGNIASVALSVPGLIDEHGGTGSWAVGFQKSTGAPFAVGETIDFTVYAVCANAL